MAVGDTQLVGSGKYGTAWGGIVVDEGGTMGDVEYDGQTPLYDQSGNPKSAGQLNQEVRAAIAQGRDAQGATASLNPPLSGYVFFS